MATEQYAMPGAGYGMVEVADALSTVIAEADRMHALVRAEGGAARGVGPPRRVSILAPAAIGATLAEDVVAQENVPAGPRSIKDGFAVVAADGVASPLTIVGEVRAGDPQAVRVSPGEAAYITTGAPLPPGSDAVAMVEDATVLDARDAQGRKRVQLRVPVAPGQDVRAAGSDVEGGATVLRAGKRIEAADVGLLASIGVPEVLAEAAPVVAFASTGAEVVRVGASPSLGAHQTWDANAPALLAACRAACPTLALGPPLGEGAGGVVDLGHAGDTRDAVVDLVRRAWELGADVLVTTGGVSMGDADCVKPALTDLSATVHFGKVRMKPGKPLTFATLRSPDGRPLLFFGLPGNPVSAFVTFHVVVLPAIRRLSGWPMAACPLQRIPVVVGPSEGEGPPFARDKRRPEFHRATLRWCAPPAFGFAEGDGAWGLEAVSTGDQVSSRLQSLVHAQCLVEVPPGEGALPRGAIAAALLIKPL